MIDSNEPDSFFKAINSENKCELEDQAMRKIIESWKENKTPSIDKEFPSNKKPIPCKCPGYYRYYRELKTGISGNLNYRSWSRQA